MQNTKVYDNGGMTADRYTIVINNDIFTMSENALSPNGCNMYSHTQADYTPTDDEKEVSVDELPLEVRTAIKIRQEA